MGLVESIKELFRPELPIDSDIVEREKRFDEQDSSREDWLVGTTYLTKGGLKELEKHPDYHPFDAHIIFAGLKNNRRYKKVKVVTDDQEKLERALKLELRMRDCNAGIFYRTYTNRDKFVGEAVPARLDCE